MSLLIKCVETINNNIERFKDCIIPTNILKKSINNNTIDFTNQYINKYYDKHSRITTYEYMLNKHPKVDKLPIIKIIKKYCYIKFFNINGSYVDMLNDPKKYTTYKTESKYGKRLKKIVRITNDALNNYKNLIIDFRDCGGGDIRVFTDAFSPLLGTGLLYYYEGLTNNIYAYYNNGMMTYTNHKLDIKRIKPYSYKNIKILINTKTASSSEFMTMIIKNSYPHTKIIGHKTGGYLTMTNSIPFEYDGIKYNLDMTVAPYIFDSDGNKYYGIIKKYDS